MRFLQRFSKPFLALSDVRRPGIVRTVRKPKRYVPALEALRDFDAVFCVLQGAPADGAIRICERSVLVFLILKKIGINGPWRNSIRSEEHTSELQSHSDLVCR